MARQARSLARFALLAGTALAVVLALVWTLTLRERGIRRLFLEYEAFRASAVFAEAFRQNPSQLPDDARVLGFGLYGPGGSSLARSGTAPERLDVSRTGAIWPPPRIGVDSLILERPLGPAAPGVPGMRFMMRSMRGGEGPPGSENPGSRGLGLPDLGGLGHSDSGGPGGPGAGAFGRNGDALAAGPRALWLEYGIGDYGRQRLELYGGAWLATAALVGLFVLLLHLYRKNAELREAEIQTRELVQLGEAARTLVHEIKNPLGVIRVQAATLRKLGDSEAAEKARAKAYLIDEEVERLAGLADRIREFLKGGEGESREIELGSWLRDFAARHEGALALSRGEQEGGAWVRVDPERLSLALDNLVSNAREAAPGKIAELSLQRRNRFWELVLADQGPGIEAEVAARMFEPFFTTKEKGTGIGLALAQRVARNAGGELAHRPRPSGGSLFALSLPALRPPT